MRRRAPWLLFLVVAATIGYYFWWRYDREARFDSEILAAAQRYNISPALVKAVVWRESWFDSTVRGSHKEIGLMQIQPIVGRDWAKEERTGFSDYQLFNPTYNTRIGAWYLHKLLKRYRNTDNPLPYALADYNAGRGNLLKWNKGEAATNSAAFIEQIGFPSTQHYVRTTMEQYENYREVFPPKK